MAADLKRIYRVFDPAPLLGDQNELYVPLDEVRGSSGLVTRLSKTIRLSEQPTFQLLAGHIGSGKSTELRRVQADLETGDARFFTVFCQILEDIDPSDTDFPDVLMAIMRQTTRELRERLGVRLKPGYFKQRWQELKGLLGSEVKFESLELESGLGKLTAAIKSSPSTRDRIRKALAATTERWIDAANDILCQAAVHARKQGYADIAIIVDDLDKLSVEQRDKRGMSIAERLFLGRHAQLTAFDCHLICTIPLALAYSCKEREIASLYEITAPAVLPLTTLFDHDGKKRAPAFERFRAIVTRRIEKARAEQKDVFASNAVMNKLVRLSGGQPRALITLVRDALIEGDLPITDETIDRVARSVGCSCSRYLHEEHWAIIEQVRKTHAFERTPANDPFSMSLLANCLILHYLNDREWYGLNPLLPSHTRQ